MLAIRRIQAPGALFSRVHSLSLLSSSSPRDARKCQGRRKYEDRGVRFLSSSSNNSNNNNNNSSNSAFSGVSSSGGVTGTDPQQFTGFGIKGGATAADAAANNAAAPNNNNNAEDLERNKKLIEELYKLQKAEDDKVAKLLADGHRCVKILETFPTQHTWCGHTPCSQKHVIHNHQQHGLVKASPEEVRDATIAKLRAKEEQQRKYGASLPHAVLLVIGGVVVAVAVLGSWLWNTGLLNRRHFLTSLFRPHQGHLLTEDNHLSNTCHGCRKEIEKDVVAAGGYLWHPHHLLCAQCGAPVENKHVFVDGKPYCEKDALYLRGHECAVCGDRFVLKKAHTLNKWGDVYCSSHSHLPSCHSCHRPISPRTTKGGVERKDGRHVCTLCNGTVLNTLKDAGNLLEVVRADLEKLTGVGWGKEEVKISLVPASHFGKDGVHTRGLTLKRYIRSTMRTRIIGREIEAIQMLDGLPSLEAGQTLAHELMHVYLFMNNFPELPHAIEEGLCELTSYLWLTAKSEQEGVDRRELDFRLTSVEDNPSRVYGQGLHLTLRSFMASNVSFAEFLESIHKTGRLPMGPITPSAAPSSPAATA